MKLRRKSKKMYSILICLEIIFYNFLKLCTWVESLVLLFRTHTAKIYFVYSLCAFYKKFFQILFIHLNYWFTFPEKKWFYNDSMLSTFREHHLSTETYFCFTSRLILRASDNFNSLDDFLTDIIGTFANNNSIIKYFLLTFFKLMFCNGEIYQKTHDFFILMDSFKKLYTKN